MKAESGSNSKKQRRGTPLYRGSKISEYRFRKVLWHFVRDHSATDTARATRLSVNAANALFRKLRIYFFEAGLFIDYYAGKDPLKYQSDNPAFEKLLLEYHFDRIGKKRGLKSPTTEPPYHLAESCWRFDFKLLMDQRPSEFVYDMMLSHLLEIIRTCGPIGTSPLNRTKAANVVMRQIDQRVLWLERNAPGFADPAFRADLKAIRSMPSDD